MKKCLVIYLLAGCVLLSGCVPSLKVIQGEAKHEPMVIKAAEAKLYDGNKVIGKLPVGTQVFLIRRGKNWSIVELPIEEYEMRIRGSVLTSALAPVPKSIYQETLGVEMASGIDRKRLQEELWKEYFPGVCINAIACAGGNIWLGTDAGLIRFPAQAPERAVIYTTSDGLIDNDILAVDVYKDEVWLGSYVGLSRFSNNSFSNYSGKAHYKTEGGLMKGAVMAIDAGERYVWLGLSSGLARFDKRTEEFLNLPRSGGWSPESGSGSAPSPSNNAIYADSILVEGNIVWHAAFNLTKSSPNGRALKTYGCGDGLIHSRVVSFTTDRSNIWAVTLGGITRIDKNGEEYERYHIAREDNPVIASVRDGEDLWVALREGLGRFDMRSRKFITYYTCWELFGGRYISALAVDDRYLWVGTSEGLWRMDKGIANSLSDEALVDDFESKGRIAYRWKLGRQGNQNVFIDSTAGANGTSSSLCIEYIAPDYKHHSLAHLSVSLENLDMTGYDGFSFLIRSDSAIRVNVDFSEEREAWSAGSWRVPQVWALVKVPFEEFKVHRQGSGNRILELNKLTRLSFGFYRDFSLGGNPEPGRIARIWIDEIRFYKNDEGKGEDNAFVRTN
jgi:hypothetical protein